MGRIIPPLNPLHVFETVTQLGNFSKAAVALNVTPSAVSRQIHALEAFLQIRLFERERHGVHLTVKGSIYRDDISRAFKIISDATTRVTHEARERPLQVRVRSTLAVKWLIPRLSLFRARFPSIDIDLVDPIEPIDFSRDNIDLAVRFGSGNWPGMHSEFLFEDVLQPVCSPALLTRASMIKDISDLQRFTWIYSHNRSDDWDVWLRAVGKSALSGRERMEFATSLFTYEAAIKGLGIAIGQLRLLESDIANGLLIPILNPIVRELSYYAVWPKEESNSRTRSFANWLKDEIRGVSRRARR